MHAQPKSNYLWIFIALSIGLALVLIVVMGAGAAAQETFPDSPFTFLALDDEQVAASLMVAQGMESVPITLRMHSALTDSVTAQIIVARAVDNNGLDVTDAFAITGGLYNIFGLTTNEITFDLLLGDLQPGSYIVTLALGQLGLQRVPAEVLIKLEVGPHVQPATLSIKESELIAEFNRSSAREELLLTVGAAAADAGAVQAVLQDVQRRGAEGPEPVLVDFQNESAPRDIARDTEEAIFVSLDPGALPAPGLYSGTVVVTAVNAEPISQPVTLIVREASLIALPQVLEITRCKPGLDWWPWLSNNLGCGDGSEGITISNNGEVAAHDVLVLQSQARTTSGLPLDIFYRSAAGESAASLSTSLPLGMIDRENPAEVIVVPASAPSLGTYSGTISIASPDLALTQDVNFKVAVRHLICFPMVIVWLGVIAGWVILRLRDPKKNPQAVKSRLAGLKKWLVDNEASLPQKIHDSVQDHLLAAEAYVDNRAISMANTRLDAADTEIAAYEKARATLDSMQQIIGQEPGYKMVQEDAEQQMAAGDLSAALTLANQAHETYKAGERLVQYDDELSRKIGANVLDAQEAQPLKVRLAQIRQEIRSEGFALGAAETQAWNSIYKVEADYLDLMSQIKRTEADPDEAALAKDLALFETEELQLLCKTDDSERLVNAPIQFELWGSLGGEKIGVQGQPQWTVLDEQGSEISSATIETEDNLATLIFACSGQYKVQAEMDGLMGSYDLAVLRRFEIETVPPQLQTYTPIRFAVVPAGPQRLSLETAVDLTYQWTISRRSTFGRTSKIESGTLNTAEFSTTLKDAGDYQLTVDISGGPEDGHWPISKMITVSKSIIDLEAESVKRRQLWATVLASIIATMGGMVAVNVFDVTYGTLQNYVVAFIWGAGVEVAGGSMASWSPLVNRIVKLFSE